MGPITLFFIFVFWVELVVLLTDSMVMKGVESLPCKPDPYSLDLSVQYLLNLSERRKAVLGSRKQHLFKGKEWFLHLCGWGSFCQWDELILEFLARLTMLVAVMGVEGFQSQVTARMEWLLEKSLLCHKEDSWRWDPKNGGKKHIGKNYCFLFKEHFFGACCELGAVSVLRVQEDTMDLVFVLKTLTGHGEM